MRAFLVIAFLVLLPAAAVAQQEPADVPTIDVIEIDGPIDAFASDFVIEAISSAAAAGSQAAILQIDSPGAVDDSIVDAIALVSDPPLPVIAWIGDAPATARGGALDLAAAASLTLAAPGAEVGLSNPLVVGQEGAGAARVEGLVTVEEAGGVVDGVEAALGPLIVGLHGRTFTVAGDEVVLETAEEVVDDSGDIRQQVVPQIRFREPGIFARTMRLGVEPAAVFFFLVAGLAFVAFEFYAIGPGIAAATAALPLFLAGYGLVTLPIGWGFWLVLAAMWLLTTDYQRGGFGVLSYIASIALPVGGWFMIDSRPQITPSIWAIVVTSLGVTLFYMFAMPTVARARFTTPTMGREYLIGKEGIAVTDAVDGALTVEVDGASWRGTTYRESSITVGSPVLVQSIQGLYLEVVEPPDTPGENREN